jgi:putative Mg2+ transporter-C (MgtC) family protein
MYGEVVIVLKMLLTAGLVGVLGMERQISHKPLSVRTVMFVGCATTLFTAIALQVNAPFVLSGIITGIGFLGGGVIVTSTQKGEVHNLTTASMVWIVAAIGILVGIDLYLVAMCATAISFVILRSKGLYSKKEKARHPDGTFRSRAPETFAP